MINRANRYHLTILIILMQLLPAIAQASSFIDPVKDGRYRSAYNKFIFGSSTDDKYRIPSMEKLNNGDIVFFAERRIDTFALNDFKRQSIVMRKLSSNGSLSSERKIQIYSNAPRANTDGGDYKHNLMNPVPVYNKETGVLHLFYNHIVTYKSSHDMLKVAVMHTQSYDNGETWTAAQDRTADFTRNSCESVIIGPGRGIQIPKGEPQGGRLLIPLHTKVIPGKDGTKYPKLDCSGYSGRFLVAMSDDDGLSWTKSNLLSTGSSKAKFNEKQIVYLNGTLHMFSRLSGEYEYDGSGLAYSKDGGQTWLKGFNEAGPKDSQGNNVAMTGRFVTPTQSGLATDGQYIYYTTSVFYSWYEGLDNRREAWVHRIDPNQMFDKHNSPVNVVQPITKSGFSNVATLYLGDNKIGVLWEEVRTWKPIKRIRNIFYTVVDTRDFRPILDPAWVDRGYRYFPVWNGSHHLLNEEILTGDKTNQWNPE